MDNKNEFFQLLILNNEEALKNFLITNGKAPKVICPIRIIENGDQDNG